MSFPVVGVVGGGQLARMMARRRSGSACGCGCWPARPRDSAAQVVPDVEVGDERDLEALRRFAKGCDVLTFDHEHVPTDHLRLLEREGVVVRPGPDALVHAQDKARDAGAADRARRAVPALGGGEQHRRDPRRSATRPGWPVVLKTPRGGYDGKGVRVVGAADERPTGWSLGAGATLLAEERVAFDRELAVLVARSPHGQAAVYPVVETVQVDGICREVLAPAAISEEHALAAQPVALRIAEGLGVTGVLAVEMFDTDGGVLVNELAMRPHNSGHWTIEGARTSQFEQHLRAVLDLPLGETSMTAPQVAMSNVLGGEIADMYGGYLHCMAHDPGVHMHMYGKDVRPGRKVGHVTTFGDDAEDVRARARPRRRHSCEETSMS